MANYYKQCSCGRYADVVPCYNCLQKTAMAAEARAKELEATVDQLRVQLAGCTGAAGGWIIDDLGPADYGWSIAYEEIKKLRLKMQKLEAVARTAKRVMDAVMEDKVDVEHVNMALTWLDAALAELEGDKDE